MDRPPTVEQALASARKEIQARISEATKFTPAECAQLARLTTEQQSWNPFVRNAAKKQIQNLHAEQQARYEAELAKVTHGFESGDAKRSEKCIRSDERIYREYVGASLGLEAQMRKAQAVLHDELPKIEKQLTLLERTGVAQLECEGVMQDAGFDKLAAAADRAYQALPRDLRRRVEFTVRREQSVLARTRGSISMDR
jgi:hypothetical protein